MRFVALDVETANADVSSICQIGVVLFDGGVVADVWHTLVDPEGRFDPMNIAVHGIRAEAVKGAPKFPEVFDRLRSYASGHVVAHHTPFDRTSLARVTGKYGLPDVDCHWLDTAKVVRRAWPQFARSGYGLKNVATAFGITFEHHAAHEDARAAGEILVRAIRDTGLLVHDWLDRVRQPIGGA